MITFNSTFKNSGIKEVPGDLFKYNTKAVRFERTFDSCTELTTIHQGLFRTNTEMESGIYTFIKCKKLNSIPADLLQNNNKLKNIQLMFSDCKSITYIPDQLIARVKNAKQNGCNIFEIFADCTGASNLNSVPNDMR